MLDYRLDPSFPLLELMFWRKVLPLMVLIVLYLITEQRIDHETASCLGPKERCRNFGKWEMAVAFPKRRALQICAAGVRQLVE